MRWPTPTGTTPPGGRPPFGWPGGATRRACAPAVWAAAEALRRHPDPLRRLFGAEVLRLNHLFDGRDEDPFAGPAVDIFTD